MKGFFLCLLLFRKLNTGDCKHYPPCCSGNSRGCSCAVCPRSQRASCRLWTAESYQSGSSHAAASMLRGLFASLHAETNSTQMRGYLQHRLNLFYKYWQEMSCLAAIFSGKFWLCSSHPAVLGFFAFRSRRWQGWHPCRVVVCASASLWRWRQSFSFLFLYWWCFFCYLSFSFPLFSGTFCCMDRDRCELLGLSSTFCISCSGGGVRVCGCKCGIQDLLSAGLHGNHAPWLLLHLWYKTEISFELSVPGWMVSGREGI